MARSSSAGGCAARRGKAHGIDDALVAGAAAEIGRHGLANLLLARIRVFSEQLVGEHEHARCAEATLKALRLTEGGLERMHLVAARQALDGRDLSVVRADRQHQA